MTSGRGSGCAPPTAPFSANTAGIAAAVIDSVAATLTGTYVVQVTSFDSLFDGTGSYRITLARSSGPITVSAGDQGGPLTVGAHAHSARS